MTRQTHIFDTHITRAARVSYLLYLPEGYDAAPARRWPLILFLHGSGERGSDLDAVRSIGLPPVVERNPAFPFIVIAPQCPLDSDWTLELDAVAALLEHVVASEAVDARRVYLTGMSMGGRGAWQLAARMPERFAALAPVCGRRPVWAYSPEELHPLKDLPTWVFHGAQDEVVPPAESEFMVAALKACGGAVRFTLYPEAAHDCWTATYGNPELYEWFLAHAGETPA